MGEVAIGRGALPSTTTWPAWSNITLDETFLYGNHCSHLSSRDLVHSYFERRLETTTPSRRTSVRSRSLAAMQPQYNGAQWQNGPQWQHTPWHGQQQPPMVVSGGAQPQTTTWQAQQQLPLASPGGTQPQYIILTPAGAPVVPGPPPTQGGTVAQAGLPASHSYVQLAHAGLPAEQGAAPSTHAASEAPRQPEDHNRWTSWSWDARSHGWQDPQPPQQRDNEYWGRQEQGGWQQGAWRDYDAEPSDGHRRSNRHWDRDRDWDWYGYNDLPYSYSTTVSTDSDVGRRPGHR